MNFCAHVNEVLVEYSYEQGCTCPLMGILDSDEKAIIKYPKNQQGILALISEFFSNKIAEIAGLSIPTWGITTIDENTHFNQQPRKKYTHYYGCCFYSKYLPKLAPASARTIKQVTNRTEFCKMILIDALVFNTDRHSTNVLISFQKNQHPNMFSIDFTHALGGPDSDIETLAIGDYESPIFWRENYDFYTFLLADKSSVTKDGLLSESSYLQERITPNVINHIFSEIPSDWTDEIGTESIDHIQKYILSRASNLDKICETILKEGGIV